LGLQRPPARRSMLAMATGVGHMWRSPCDKMGIVTYVRFSRLLHPLRGFAMTRRCRSCVAAKAAHVTHNELYYRHAGSVAALLNHA
jgi:hypothetical protein